MYGAVYDAPPGTKPVNAGAELSAENSPKLSIAEALQAFQKDFRSLRKDIEGFEKQVDRIEDARAFSGLGDFGEMLGEVANQAGEMAEDLVAGITMGLGGVMEGDEKEEER